MTTISPFSSHRRPVDIFIVHHTKDEGYLEAFKPHFVPSIRKHAITVWDTSQILASLVRQEEIEHALQSAKVAVLLVSIDFLASDSIMEQILPSLCLAAKQKGIKIINVIVRPCEFNATDLREFQPINASPLSAMTDPDRETQWSTVAKLASEMVLQHVGRIQEIIRDQLATSHTLAQHFFRCRSMKDRSSRATVISHLPQEMVQEIRAASLASTNEQATDFVEVLDLVEICSSYPDGMEKLAYALYQLEKTSISWRALDALLLNIGQKTVTYTWLQHLTTIFAPLALPHHILKRAYEESVPDGWITPQADDVPHLLSLLINDLATITIQNDDTYPLLEFVQRIAVYVLRQGKIASYNHLSEWINARSQERGLTMTQLSALRHKAQEKRPPTTFYLLITLDGDNTNAFSVYTWLLDHDYNIIQNTKDNEQQTIESMPAFLNDLLATCGTYLSPAEMNHLVIEFSLPNSWLSYPLDRLPVDMGMMHEALGIPYQVVVRSFTRAHRQKMWPAWQKKWEIFQESIKEKNTSLTSTDTISFSHDGQYKTASGFSTSLRNSSAACLALTFVPPEIRPHTSSVFEAALQAGIPIALWPRKCTNYPMAPHDFFSSFVSPNTLPDLPVLVQKQRNAAVISEDEHHQGHHITLLWDDPNRLPPILRTELQEEQLTIPSVRRGA